LQRDGLKATVVTRKYIVDSSDGGFSGTEINRAQNVAGISKIDRKSSTWK
jgi:hypothetical protein